MNLDFSKVLKELGELSSALFTRSDLSGDEKRALVRAEAKGVARELIELGEEAAKKALPAGWHGAFDVLTDLVAAGLQEEGEDFFGDWLAETVYQIEKRLRERAGA